MSKDINDGSSRLEELLNAADAGDVLTVQSRIGEITELALQLLDGVIREVESAQDFRDALDKMQELFAERALLALGVAWRTREHAVTARLFALQKGPKGIKSVISDLTKAIKAAAETKNDAASSLGALLRAIGDDRLRKLECPPGWMCDMGGVWKDGAENVARAPMIIRRITVDVDRGTLRWSLCWWRDGRWHSADMDRRSAVDVRGIIELAAKGAPVASTNAADLVRWLVDFEARNHDRIPVERSTVHLGWQDDRIYISSPDDDRVRVVVTEGEAEVVRGWGARAGTWEGWCEAVRQYVSPHPLPMLGIYAALVPVLLRVLGEQGFTVDWSGDSSGGKTSTLAVSASVWGVPDLSTRGGIIRPWLSSSSVGPVAIAAVLHSVPVYLDETQLMQTPRQRDAVAEMLYALQAGQESNRGRQDGHLRVSRTWQTCLLTTGESAITSFSGSTGARARALCLRGRPFGDAGKEWVDKTRAALLEHHGHLGPRFVDYVNRTPPERLKARFGELREGYAHDAPDGITGRITGYVALLHMVAEVVHDVLDVPGDSGTALRVALDAAMQGGEEADRPLEALRDLYSWAAARPDQFYGTRQTTSTPPHGWFGRWGTDHLGVGMTIAQSQLAEWGYDVENVLCSWRDRGWTDCSEGRNGNLRKDKLIKIDGRPIRMVVIRLDAVDKKLGLKGP